jgi:hypothetical protein
MNEVVACWMIMYNMIVEDKPPNDCNEHLWDFQGEMVAPIHGTSSWQQYLHWNVEITDENMSIRLEKDMTEHQRALASYE